MNTQDKRKLAALLASIGELTAHLNDEGPDKENVTDGLLKFSTEEISKMPKTLKKQFIIEGCVTHVRKRSDERYKRSYEIRYRRNGYNISASGGTVEAAKENFIRKLKCLTESDAPSIPTTFHKFTKYWLENFHKRSVCAETYVRSVHIFDTHIAPFVRDIELKQIAPALIQQTVDRLSDRPRAAESVYGLFSQIFKSAVNHGIIQVNPVAIICYKPHQRKHGTALTKAEERSLLEGLKGKYKTLVAVLLFTGLRPNELKTARIEGPFIVARNSKRKGGKIEYKKIPITPMLRPFIEGMTELPKSGENAVMVWFKRALTGHKLYDLRTTFQTRCTECGISDAAIGEFMGNSIGKLKDTYTDLSDEYLLKEGEKLSYEI